MDTKERYSRQKDLVPADKLPETTVMVIGVGAIGRNVALQLTSIGVQNLMLVDFDVVEESNIATQGYYESDLGVLKVNATEKICKQINNTINIEAISSRFKKSMEADVVFCCVDSISTRKFIWESVMEKSKIFIDGRMTAEVFRVLVADDGHGKLHYPSTLFTEQEAFTGSCTAKSTVYCANIAAGFMVQAFTKWLREFKNDIDVMYNLLSNEVTIVD